MRNSHVSPLGSAAYRRIGLIAATDEQVDDAIYHDRKTPWPWEIRIWVWYLCRLVFQARGILSGIPPELFQALPYLMTILVLVLVSNAGARRRLGAPAALGTPYVREER